MRVRLTDEAKRQVATIERWWRANRDKNPSLFMSELRDTRRQLVRQPRSGKVYLKDESRTVYRIVLRRTRHLLYYEILGTTLWVVSVWGAPKEGPPELSTPPPETDPASRRVKK